MSRRRSPPVGPATAPGAEDPVDLLRQRVARRGGTLREVGDELWIEGLGPDPGLAYRWIREAAAQPLRVPREAVAGVGGDGVPSRVDVLLDGWIRSHGDRVRQRIAGMLHAWPSVAPTAPEVASVVLGEPQPLPVSRARHEAAARESYLAFLQLRESPAFGKAEARIEACDLSERAIAVLRRALALAAEPAEGLNALAARRVAIVRWAVAELESCADDPDLLAAAVRDVVLPLAPMVDPADLDALLAG